MTHRLFRPTRIATIAALTLLIAGGAAAYVINKKENDKKQTPNISQPVRLEGEPKLATETLAEGLSNVWDVAQAPDKTLFYTERAGRIGAILDGKATTIYEPEGVAVRGEGGMLGMTLDPQFVQNRYLYACFNATSDIRVVRFTVAMGNNALSDRTDIVTGLPVNPSGRHSGCRPKFAPDGYLWISTGDTARSGVSQDPASLGGKVLRVDRDGKAAPGNQGGQFDPRIYSYGHRNVQGLAFYTQPRDGIVGYSIEHGSDRDDEVNLLQSGNFGWDPGPDYDEGVAMTDLIKFPDAVGAVWSSGRPTIAPSGGVILEGPQWKDWEGRLMMAVQKEKHVRLMEFDEFAKTVTSEKEILTQFGRIRTITIGSDGSAYITTDNGNSEDKIIKVTPQ